ncbi:MAG: hypothetical protein ACLRIS_17880, partial [Flavonifractor plautii]
MQFQFCRLITEADILLCHAISDEESPGYIPVLTYLYLIEKSIIPCQTPFVTPYVNQLGTSWAFWKVPSQSRLRGMGV